MVKDFGLWIFSLTALADVEYKNKMDLLYGLVFWA